MPRHTSRTALCRAVSRERLKKAESRQLTSHHIIDGTTDCESSQLSVAS